MRQAITAHFRAARTGTRPQPNTFGMLDSLKAGDIHVELGDEVQQDVDGDPTFHACQRGSETAVNPVTEAKVVAGVPPIDVEAIWIGEGALISGGRTVDEHDRLVLGYHRAMKLDVDVAPADVILRRSLVTQQLFKRGGNETPVLS